MALDSKSKPCFQFSQVVSLIITDSDQPQRLHTWFTGKGRAGKLAGLGMDHHLNSPGLEDE